MEAIATEIKKKGVFETLSAINVNDKVEKKNGLTYLSWAWAWAETKKHFPGASYNILETEYDENLGYMCYTTVTIENETIKMWLPVLDGANKVMKREPYTYTAKKWDNGRRVDVELKVEAATMFDINKAMMRCLVKNLAMFGLGLYVYAGEDLPDTQADVQQPIANTPAPAASGSTIPANAQPAPATAEAATAQPPATGQKITLKVDDENWGRVSLYIKDNAENGIDKILQQLKRKYSISPTVKKAIEKLINESKATEEPQTIQQQP
ncbi:MAG: protein of unknown function DUF1071 [Podoviridae sp. ctrTa16]|nr:MAG: protein of unknown function DUF1071 [Podoviridae sp. ctrTa16]